MSSFIACAKACAVTLIVWFLAFQAFALVFTLAVYAESSTVMVHSLLNLDTGTTVVIGLAAGWFGARFDRQRPLLTAAITAALVELLHASMGAGLVDAPMRSLTWVVVAVACALAVAWLRTGFRRPASPAPPEQTTS